MKKTIRNLVLLTITFSFIGCAWQVPKSVSVKTNATYNFGIGSINKDYSEYFTAESIIDGSLTTDENSKTYDYFPDKTNSQIQKYLMKMPIQDIAVNFTEYFNATSLAESITDLSFDKTVDIPELKLTLDEAFPGEALMAGINAILTTTGTSASVTFGGDFDQIKYSSGGIRVTSSSDTAGGLIEFHYKGNVVASGFMYAGIGSVDLTGVTLHKTGMTVSLPSGCGEYTMVVKPESEINTISGFTTSEAIVVPVNTQISNGNNADDFADCVIGQGEMVLEIDIPDSWTNVSIAMDAALSGGIATVSPKVNGNIKTIYLDGLSLTNSSTTLSSNVEMSFSNSSLVFGDEAKIVANTTVTSYAEIGIVLTDVNSRLNETELISQEMKDMVERLILTESGLKGSYKNTLPAGNGITLTANSLFIGLDNASQTLAAGVSEASSISLLSNGEHTVKFRNAPQAADEFDSMDFRIDILLPGATPQNPNKIVVQNVVPTASYQIAISLEPDINWREIVLYSEGVEQVDCRPTGLNICQMFASFSDAMGADFGGKITNKTLPISIYAVKPEMSSFEKAKFTGELEMFFGTESSGSFVEKREYGTLTFMEDGDMNFTDMPEITFEDKTIVSNIQNYPPSEKGDLIEITNNAANDPDGSVYVRFKLKFTNSAYSTETFTVTWEDYKASGSKNSSIAIFAFVEVPLDFNLSDEVPIDLLKMAGNSGGKDILGRTSAPSDAEKADFLEAIRAIRVNYQSSSLPFYGFPTASLRLDLDGSESNLFEEEELNLDGGSFLVYDYSDIINTYPLIPVASIVLHKGYFTVPREVFLKTSISLAIEMDPNHETVIFGGE